MLNLHHLRVFFHVAKNLSYTLAAKDLYISQPAVTKQVKALEELLDLKLFVTKGSKTNLTEEGKTLFEYAKKLFDYEKEIELAVEEIKTLKRGILQLGTPKPFQFFLSFLMDTFHKEYPSIQIEIIEGTSLSLMRDLLNNKAEIVLGAKVEEHPKVRFIPFSREEVSFVVRPDHPLAQRKVISLEEFSEISIILKAVGAGTRKVVMDLFKEHNVTPKILLETNDSDFIKDVVQRGEAGTFLADADITEPVKEGKLVKVPIEGLEIFLEINILYLKDQPLSVPARTFLSLLGRPELTSKHFPYLIASWPEDFPFAKEDL